MSVQKVQELLTLQTEDDINSHIKAMVNDCYCYIMPWLCLSTVQHVCYMPVICIASSMQCKKKKSKTTRKKVLKQTIGIQCCEQKYQKSFLCTCPPERCPLFVVGVEVLGESVWLQQTVQQLEKVCGSHVSVHPLIQPRLASLSLRL